MRVGDVGSDRPGCAQISVGAFALTEHGKARQRQLAGARVVLCLFAALSLQSPPAIHLGPRRESHPPFLIRRQN